MIIMRTLMIAVAAMLLSLPATASASACGAGAKSARTVATTFSADEMKPAKKKLAKKAVKKKLGKVEYMRAVPVK
jgi:hypothetical protein